MALRKHNSNHWATAHAGPQQEHGIERVPDEGRAPDAHLAAQSRTGVVERPGRATVKRHKRYWRPGLLRTWALVRWPVTPFNPMSSHSRTTMSNLSPTLSTYTAHREAVPCAILWRATLFVSLSPQPRAWFIRGTPDFIR